jgi:hypothetical protein
MSATINQSGASAGGDLVGGNKTVNNYFHPASSQSGIVEQLLAKLQAEIDKNEQVRHIVENLQYFYKKRAPDGINGLEAKLTAGRRDHEIYLALEKKELFAKLLEKWSLYASAQEIFACLLAKAEHEFSMFVYPKIGKLDQDGINQLVNDRIVTPAISECGVGVFTLNHSIVMGMIYWLAEQCFVRWHQ